MKPLSEKELREKITDLVYDAKEYGEELYTGHVKTYEEIEKELTTLHPGEDIDIVVEDYDRLIAPMVNYGSALVYYRLKKSNGVRGTSKEGYVIINRTQPSGAICSPTNDICEEN